MPKYIFFLVLALGVSLSGCQSSSSQMHKSVKENFGADDFEEGIRYANRGDYKNAFRYWEPIAQHGNIKAQHNIAVLYDKGLGIGQNYAEALKWYRKAAEQGYVQSQNNLGVMYEKGNGVDIDYMEALKWYKLAAAQKFDLAQFNIGSMYENGNGVGVDYQETQKWYQLAAEQGNSSALNGLGYLNHQGLGLPKNIPQAFNFYQQAAAKNDNVAQYNLGTWYLDDKDIPNAVHWLSISANQGNKKAQIDLGNMYYKGQVIIQDYSKAAKYWLMAAQQGDENAQYHIGLMYSDGVGVTKNLEEARRWLVASSLQGMTEATSALQSLLKKYCPDQLNSFCPPLDDKGGSFGLAAGIGVYGGYSPCASTDAKTSERIKQTLLASMTDNPILANLSKVEVIGIAKNDDSNVRFSLAALSHNGDSAADEAINAALSQIQIKRPPPNSEYQRNHPCIQRYSVQLKN